MNETERPGGPGDDEQEATDGVHPTPDDIPDAGDLGGGGSDEEEGPDVDELDKDPAYNPDDEGLKGIKGG